MEALAALKTVNFEWATHLDAVWSDPAFDVPSLNKGIRGEISSRLDQLTSSASQHSPLGLVICGVAGAGKTHLLSALRKEAFARSASFILVDMTDVRDFWDTAQLSFLRALYRKGYSGREQFREILQHLFEKYLGPDRTVPDVEALAKIRPPALINQTNHLIRALANVHSAEVMEHQDVLRALVLVNSDEFEIRNVGFGWLQGMGIDEDQKLKHGFMRSEMASNELLRSLAWLYSLRGPVVVAFDQLDSIVTEHYLASTAVSEDPAMVARQRMSLAIIEGISSGLMALRDITKRTLLAISCLDATWDTLVSKTLRSATDRFEKPIRLADIEHGEVARQIVATRLGDAYRAAKFTPPFPTWPFETSSFDKLRLAPRELLKRCHSHVRDCIQHGRVSVLKSFDASANTTPEPAGDASLVEKMNERFAHLRSKVDPVALLESDSDEQLRDQMLEAACQTLEAEAVLTAGDELLIDRDFRNGHSYEPLHARIRLVKHDERDRELHFALRFLDHENHIAFQSRLTAAMTASGIDRALDFRRLRILRTGPLPGGKKTKTMVDTFTSRGGQFVEPSREELGRLYALSTMIEESTPDDFKAWARAAKPTANIAFLSEARRWLFEGTEAEAKAETKAETETETEIVTPPKPVESKPKPTIDPTLPMGRRIQAAQVTSERVGIPLENLRKHTVVLAGAGSGKTVFVRRLIEEAAVRGVPSIVIDAANDLSRLGDRWPAKPDAFGPEDEAQADAYFKNTETIVWTPGRGSGNGLKFDPLPDLRSLVRDAEEYENALDLTRSGLEPLALVGGAKTGQGKLGVLRSALDGYIKRDGVGLDGFIDFLSDLPPECDGNFQKAAETARKMADALREQRQINPMLRAPGAPLDAERLLGVGAAKTRVSVINFVGLGDLGDQQVFLAQLATMLFSWIKANPAKDRPLSGLLVIDEAKDFVPSMKAVSCRDALQRLAAQARKYGLGLVFATQAPKSIDHNIIANCSTQVYGQANSPAALEVIESQIKQRGGNPNDVAKLGTGKFYVFSEGMVAPVKVQSPLCLSHHPSSPLDEEGVLERAKTSKSRAEA